MPNKKGVFIGAYIPGDLKKSLQERANSHHRTLSQEIGFILKHVAAGDYEAIARDEGGSVTCLRCENVWTPRLEDPNICPACKSPHWNTARE
jgi:Zn finger protein HypA/HybF involved in hydrogenase expression